VTRPAIPDDRKDEVVHLCLAGFTDDQVAARFHCSRLAVIHFRERHGITKKRGGNWHRKMVGKDIEPVEVYFDPKIKHMVKVMPPGTASGDLPADEEAINDPFP
jgi:hypothetical protein